MKWHARNNSTNELWQCFWLYCDAMLGLPIHLIIFFRQTYTFLYVHVNINICVAVLLVAVLRFYLLQRCGFTCCRAAVLLVAVLLFYLLQGCGFTCCSAAVLLVAVYKTNQFHVQHGFRFSSNRLVLVRAWQKLFFSV